VSQANNSIPFFPHHYITERLQLLWSTNTGTMASNYWDRTRWSREKRRWFGLFVVHPRTAMQH